MVSEGVMGRVFGLYVSAFVLSSTSLIIAPALPLALSPLLMPALAKSKALPLQIVGIKTSFDKATLTYSAKGKASASVSNQEAELSADEIRYSERDRMIDARGHVKFTREGKSTESQALKFEIDSKEYLITDGKSSVGVILLK